MPERFKVKPNQTMFCSNMEACGYLAMAEAIVGLFNCKQFIIVNFKLIRNEKDQY